MRRSGTSRRARIGRGGIWFFSLFCVVAGGAGGAGIAFDSPPPPQGPTAPHPAPAPDAGAEHAPRHPAVDADETPASPRGEREESGGEGEPLPGRDDPDEFYKKPPRKPKRIDRLPA